jgi:hypothetical protein
LLDAAGDAHVLLSYGLADAFGWGEDYLYDFTYAGQAWTEVFLGTGHRFSAAYGEQTGAQLAYAFCETQGQYPYYYVVERTVYRAGFFGADQTLDPDGMAIVAGMALDSQEKPHLAYYESSVGLRWMTNAGGDWLGVTVAPSAAAAYVGYPADIAIGADGAPRFVYYAEGAIYHAVPR